MFPGYLISMGSTMGALCLAQGYYTAQVGFEPQTSHTGNRRFTPKLSHNYGPRSHLLRLCSNCTAEQRLCFHYMDSTIPDFLIFEISSFWPSSVAAQAGLCQTWSETQDCFSRSWPNYEESLIFNSLQGSFSVVVAYL